MIADAIDTVLTLGWALLAWIVLLAVVAGLALYAVTVTVWATVRGAWRAWRWLNARLTASDASDAPPVLHEASGPHGARTARPAPSWAHTQPIDIEEAA